MIDRQVQESFAELVATLGELGRALLRLLLWALVVAVAAGIGYLLGGPEAAVGAGLVVAVVTVLAMAVTEVLGIGLAAGYGLVWLVRRLRAPREP